VRAAHGDTNTHAHNTRCTTDSAQPQPETSRRVQRFRQENEGQQAHTGHTWMVSTLAPTRSPTEAATRAFSPTLPGPEGQRCCANVRSMACSDTVGGGGPWLADKPAQAGPTAGTRRTRAHQNRHPTAAQATPGHTGPSRCSQAWANAHGKHATRPCKTDGAGCWGWGTPLHKEGGPVPFGPETQSLEAG
jgi:hypothetical protein